MTVRYVLVAIDDEQPLGPQMRAALGVLSWETVRELTGNAFGLRRLRQLFDSAEISARHTVVVGSMLRPHAVTHFPGGYGVMTSLFSGGQASVQQPVQPVTPTPDDSAAQDAKRKELAADAASVGRSQTILTEYALATQTPNTLKSSLGGA